MSLKSLIAGFWSSVVGRRSDGERGAAFVMVLVAMVILYIMGAGFTIMISNQLKSLKADRSKEKAYFIAEAGLQRSVVRAMKYPNKPVSDRAAVPPAPASVGLCTGQSNIVFGDGQYTIQFRSLDSATLAPLYVNYCDPLDTKASEYKEVKVTGIVYESVNDLVRPVVVELSQLIHNPFSRAIWSTGDVAFRSSVDKRWCTLDFVTWIIDAVGGSSAEWGIVFCPKDLWSISGKIYGQKRPLTDYRRYCPGIPGSILGGIAGTVVGWVTGIPFLGNIGSSLGEQYLDAPEWWSSCGAKCLGWWSDIKDRYFFGWFIGCWSSCWYWGSTKSQCNKDFNDGEYNEKPDITSKSGYPAVYGEDCCGIKLCFVCGILPCDLLGIGGPPGSGCAGAAPCPSEAGFDSNGDGIDDQWNYCCNPFIGSCGKKMGAVYRVKDVDGNWRGCGGAGYAYTDALGGSWTAPADNGYLGNCDMNTNNDIIHNIKDDTVSDPEGPPGNKIDDDGDGKIDEDDDEEQSEINDGALPANKGFYYLYDTRPFPQVVPPPDPRTPGSAGDMVYMEGSVATQFLKDNGYLYNTWVDGDLTIDWKWWQSLGNQKVGIWGLVYVKGNVNFTAATFASLAFSAYPGFLNDPPASDPEMPPGTLMVQYGDAAFSGTGNPDFGRVNIVLLDGKSLTLESCCGMQSKGIYYVGGPVIDHDKNADTPKVRMGGDIIFSATSRFGWICNLLGGVLPVCKWFSSFTGSAWFQEIKFEGSIIGRNIYFIGAGQKNEVSIENNPDLQIPESFYNTVSVSNFRQLQ